MTEGRQGSFAVPATYGKPEIASFQVTSGHKLVDKIGQLLDVVHMQEQRFKIRSIDKQVLCELEKRNLRLSS